MVRGIARAIGIVQGIYSTNHHFTMCKKRKRDSYLHGMLRERKSLWAGDKPWTSDRHYTKNIKLEPRG